MRKFLLSIAIPLIAAQASADTAGEARAVAASGDYDAALRLLRAEMEASPRTVTPQLLMLAGEYADKLGERAEATNYFEQARTRGNNAANAALASLAFREYDFNKASELYARYARGLKKGVPEDEEVRVGRERLAMARDFIDRVEKIEIIDSVAVDKGSFFRAYRLSKSAGSITDSSVLPPDERVGVRTVFTPESGDLRMWNAPGPDGKSHIMESIRLTDGSWHLPVVAPEELNEGGDAAFPYMMPDGSTFYFANNGENSIGGYDIFVSNRDTEDGSYMTPQNLGMPFNSPYDDYMLVIDENAGVGWWATDRNRLPDNKITVYAFIPNEVRVNVAPDAPDLISRARVADFRATQLPGKDYSAILNSIETSAPAAPDHKEFVLRLGHGVTYTSYSDFRSAEARTLMKRLVSLSHQAAERRETLSGLRKKYHAGERSLAREIATLESQVEADRNETGRLRKQVIRIEASGK